MAPVSTTIGGVEPFSIAAAVAVESVTPIVPISTAVGDCVTFSPAAAVAVESVEPTIMPVSTNSGGDVKSVTTISSSFIISELLLLPPPLLPPPPSLSPSLLLIILTLDSVLVGVVRIKILPTVVVVVDPTDNVGNTSPSTSPSSSSGGAVTPVDSLISAAMAMAPAEPLLLLTARRVLSTAVLPFRRMARQRPCSSLYRSTVDMSATTTPGPRIAPAKREKNISDAKTTIVFIYPFNGKNSDEKLI
jgi:hypothetical protein